MSNDVNHIAEQNATYRLRSKNLHGNQTYMYQTKKAHIF